MSLDTRITLVLSEGGNSFSLKSSGASTFPELEEVASTFPQVEEALSCVTSKQVLAFLEKIKGLQVVEYLAFAQHHENASDATMAAFPYPESEDLPCNLDDLIASVKLNILDENEFMRIVKRKKWCVLH